MPTATATAAYVAHQPAIDKATADQFRARVAASGISITAWARAQNFAGQSVSRVLNGYDMARSGRAKEIADAIIAVVRQGN